MALAELLNFSIKKTFDKILIFTRSQELGTLSRYHNSCMLGWLLGWLPGCLSLPLSMGQSVGWSLGRSLQGFNSIPLHMGSGDWGIENLLVIFW